MYVPPSVFTFGCLTVTPLDSGLRQLRFFVCAPVLLSARKGSSPDEIPRSVSQNVQLPETSVRLIRINLTPLMKPQSMSSVVPLPVYEPMSQMPGTEAQR